MPSLSSQTSFRLDKLWSSIDHQIRNTEKMQIKCSLICCRLHHELISSRVGLTTCIGLLTRFPMPDAHLFFFFVLPLCELSVKNSSLWWTKALPCFNFRPGGTILQKFGVRKAKAARFGKTGVLGESLAGKVWPWTQSFPQIPCHKWSSDTFKL